MILSSCCHLTHSFTFLHFFEQKIRLKDRINFRLDIFGRNISDVMLGTYITDEGMHSIVVHYWGCCISGLRSMDAFDIISKLYVFEMVFSLKDR